MKPLATLTAIVVGAASVGFLALPTNAAADVQRRTVQWTWESPDQAEPSVTCSAQSVPGGFVEVHPTQPTRLLVSVPNSTVRDSGGPVGEVAHLYRVDEQGNMSGRMPAITPRIKSFKRLIRATDLRDVAGLGSLWLEWEVPGGIDNQPSRALGQLVEQWRGHWCLDDCKRTQELPSWLALPVPDRVGLTRTDYVYGGFETWPPMRPEEQSQLADCLKAFQPSWTATQWHYQLSGAVSWEAAARWSRNCGTVHATNQIPPASYVDGDSWFPGEPLDRCRSVQRGLFSSIGRSFVGEGFGGGQDGIAKYLCDLSSPYLDEPSLNMDGYQVRDRFDRAYGDFPGFECPWQVTE